MISKSLRFAAPFRSSTFNSDKALAQGLNGVVSGGKVSTSGGIVTIQPLTFVQQGRFNTSPDALSAALPSSLVAPYFVAVTSSSPVQTSSEVITPTFVKRPQDVSAGTVLVAQWDGQEWRSLEKLQLAEILDAIRVRSTIEDLVGIGSGFDATVVGPNLSLTKGTLVDRQGATVIKSLPAVLPLVGADVDSADRVDYLVYRRPDDSPYRSGSVELVTGTTFDPSAPFTMSHLTNLGNVSKPNGLAKAVFSAANETYFFYIEDYASRAALIFRKASDNMGTVGSPVSIATVLNSFDVVVNPVGSIDIVYARGNNVYYQRVSGAGASIYSERLIATSPNPVRNPKIVWVRSGNTYFLHVVYEQVVSPSEFKLNYVRLSSSNTTETPSLSLVSLSSQVTHASLDKDDDDSLIFLAYENQTTARAYLRTLDASTATNLAVPATVGSVLELQSDTLIVSTATVAPASGASYPVVKRGNNKDTYVFWLHNKGSANGLAIYNPRYKDLFGHQAIILDLVTVGEDITKYGVALDGMNDAYITFMQASAVKSVAIDTYSGALVRAAATVSGSTASGLDVAQNVKGGLVHTYASVAGASVNNGSVSGVQYFGSGTFLASQPITAAEFVMTAADYLALPTAPTTGDTLVITSAGANNGLYNWVSVRSFTVSAVNYVAITTDVAAFDNSVPTGSVQFKIQGATATNFVKSTGTVLDNLRSFRVPPTDVYLARYRTSDGVVAVASPAIEETTTVSRLYEFMNSFVGGGGRVSWEKVAAQKLSFTNDFTVNFFNRKQTISVTAAPLGITVGPNQVAYVTIPDSDAATSTTMQVVDFGSGILDRHGKDIIALFWNIGGTLYTKFYPFALTSGETAVLGQDVGEILASQLKIVEHPTNKQRVIITGADATLPDGSKLAQVMSNLNVKFDGAQVDFATGSVFAADGTTPLGVNFTPVVPALNQFRWFSITAIPYNTTFDNQITLQLSVKAAATDGGNPIGAAFATYVVGKPVGQVVVPGTAFGVGDILQSNVRQVGFGGGGGGGSGAFSIFGADPELSGDGSTTAFNLLQKPLNSASVFPFIDGVYQDPNFWTFSGTQTITFLTAPVLGQKITFRYVLFDQDFLVGFSEAIGVGNGATTGFPLTGLPTSLSSTLVFLDGVQTPTDDVDHPWSLLVSGSLATIVFGIAPDLGQKVSTVYFSSAGTVITGSGPPPAAAEFHGSRSVPVLINPAAGIVPTTAMEQTWWIKPTTTGIQQLITAGNQISAGITLGQAITLIGVSSSDYFRLVDGTGFNLEMQVDLHDHQAVKFVWDGVSWFEISRRI
jgi:hypothetical protein